MLRFDLLWQYVFGTGCRGGEDVLVVVAADRVGYVARVEERCAQLVSQGVVGGAARRCHLTPKGLWSGRRIEEGGWEKDDGERCIQGCGARGGMLS